MAEVKYQYAYDENGVLVSIDDYTKETSKLHKYYCVGCGRELLPRAIGSKYKKAHFYHKEIIDCSGETYLHKLGKVAIRQKFDTSSHFYISYYVDKVCDQTQCELRNNNCKKEHVTNVVDLKQYYDTCSEEKEIKGFVADLLLTNSENANIPPILIEICVTHACEDEKIQSGLKIIELSIKKEQDVKELFEANSITEKFFRKQKAKFVSFKRQLKASLESPINRYILEPSKSLNGILTEVTCKTRNYKLFEDSLTELNFAHVHGWGDKNIFTPLIWMAFNKQLRRCNLCKFYYATQYENNASCKLYRKYGTPQFPRYDYANACKYYLLRDYEACKREIDGYHFEEVVSVNPIAKKEYRVIIAGSKSFDNYCKFVKECDRCLSDKIKTHNVVLLYSTSWIIKLHIEDYSIKRNLIVEPHEPEWNNYNKQAVYVSNHEMLSKANEVIVFWDGEGKVTKSLIDEADDRGIKVSVIRY